MYFVLHYVIRGLVWSTNFVKFICLLNEIIVSLSLSNQLFSISKMKIHLPTLLLAFSFILQTRADCLNDPFCTDCSNTTSCSMCTDNSVEALRFKILQPNGTCFATNTTNTTQYIADPNVYGNKILSDYH